MASPAPGNATLIPALDLRDGVVVRARGGVRSAYAPLRSRLTNSADPVTVVEALRARYGVRQVYIADLDAIVHGIDGHRTAVAAIRHRFPEVSCWVDAGPLDPRMDEDPDVIPVIGTETLPADTAQTIPDHAVLSMDFRGSEFLGPDTVRRTPALWPRRVIVMQLGAVGADTGPDLHTLAALRRHRPDAQWYVAGGVRDDHDLRALLDHGAAGALLASALYDCRLPVARG